MNGGGDLLPARPLRDVVRVGARRAAALHDARDLGLGRGEVEVRDRDRGALVGEPRRRGGADPAAAAGHERDACRSNRRQLTRWATRRWGAHRTATVARLIAPARRCYPRRMDGRREVVRAAVRAAERLGAPRRRARDRRAPGRARGLVRRVARRAAGEVERGRATERMLEAGGAARRPDGDARCGLRAHARHLARRRLDLGAVEGDARIRNLSLTFDPSGEDRRRLSQDPHVRRRPARRRDPRVGERPAGRRVRRGRRRRLARRPHVCYDLRFCELYRSLALLGAEAFTVPAGFTLAHGPRPLGGAAARPRDRERRLRDRAEPARELGSRAACSAAR